MKLVMRLLAASLLVLVVPLSGVAAGSQSATYDYLIGEGFICGLGPSACPVFAVAPNGDYVELTGSGTISIQPKSASGSGAFSHFDADDNLLATGTWIATDLISFHFYGCIDLGLIVCGGQALVGVELTAGGVTFPGILTIDCEFGEVQPFPPGAVEGVTLNVPGVIHFNKSFSGFTVFLPD